LVETEKKPLIICKALSTARTCSIVGSRRLRRWKQTSELSTAISRLEGEITLLREYRTRLIADMVTGKLDVREVAAGLPEEELQDQLDASAGYDADEAEDDDESDLIDTAED
jgi:hypothetical protein